MKKLLLPYKKEELEFKNHLVMAPMTRSRAINNVPNALMAQYYRQRSGAGLIITEGTAPSPDGLGYPRIPGIYSQEQVEGWKKVTQAVHATESKIFLQLMHTGRIAHADNLPQGSVVVGPSDIKAAGQIYTDSKGRQDHTQPVALTGGQIQVIIKHYVTAAKNAMAAGFDGVELHAANGYLLEQFLNPHVNNRIDAYGGSIANRARLTIEVAEQVVKTIGKERVGIRFSPFSTLGDLQPYAQDEVHETYTLLASEMERIGLVYIHISANQNIPQKTFDAIRSAFKGTIILCNGLTPETAEQALQEGFADLAAMGGAFLANPDLVERIEALAPLNQIDPNTLYTPDEAGYIDYPTMSGVAA